MLLRVPKTESTSGAGAVLLGGAAVVWAHLCRGCFSVIESGTPRFLHGRPRRFLHPLL